MDFEWRHSTGSLCCLPAAKKLPGHELTRNLRSGEAVKYYHIYSVRVILATFKFQAFAIHPKALSRWIEGLKLCKQKEKVKGCKKCKEKRASVILAELFWPCFPIPKVLTANCLLLHVSNDEEIWLVQTQVRQDFHDWCLRIDALASL